MAEKIYQNIYAYKSKIDAIGGPIIFTVYFCFCILFSILSTIELHFLIGVAITAIIWVWSLIKYIKYKSIPDLILTQKNDNLYIYPDKNEQIIVPLKDVIETKKKNFRTRYGKSPDGKLIIITKTHIYKLAITNLNLIFSRLEANRELFNDYISLWGS